MTYRPPIRVGASACLLGEPVRWNGGTLLDRWLRDTLGSEVELLPVCPEVEVGMGVPRDPVDLYRVHGTVRMISRSASVPPPPAGKLPDGRDWTEPMAAFAARWLAELPPLDGFVWKARSPSCGYRSTALRRPRGSPGITSALFAAAFSRARPFTPCVDEEQLAEASGRGAFVERIFASARLRKLLEVGFTVDRLAAFHAAEGYRLLAHSHARCRALGRIAAGASSNPPNARLGAYAAGFTAALAIPATAKRTAGVLTHAVRRLRRAASAGERDTALTAIAAYARGEGPLQEALSAVRELVLRHGEPHLERQTLLFPDPLEWKLRFGS